jgi:uncharacterized surface protein with fasciclin (FAS1) repeats
MQNPRIFLIAFLTICLLSLDQLSQAQDRDRANIVNNKELDLRYGQLFEGIAETQNHTLMELLRMEEDFSIFVDLIERAGLEESINRMEAVTILAPANYAFEALPSDELEELKSSRNQSPAREIIRSHIIQKELYLKDLQDGQSILTAVGENLEVEEEEVLRGEQPPYIYVGGSRIVKPDVKAGNGVIHVLDALVF